MEKLEKITFQNKKSEKLTMSPRRDKKGLAEEGYMSLLLVNRSYLKTQKEQDLDQSDLQIMESLIFSNRRKIEQTLFRRGLVDDLRKLRMRLSSYNSWATVEQGGKYAELTSVPEGAAMELRFQGRTLHKLRLGTQLPGQHVSWEKWIEFLH